MDLKSLIEAVKEQGLTRTQLEDYRDQMTSLFASMALEMAEIEKAEALYFMAHTAEGPAKTDISVKRSWAITTNGLRQIELKHSLKALEKLLSSLKSRIFSIY